MSNNQASNVNKKKRLPVPDESGDQAKRAEGRVEQKLKSERVQELLQALPDWELSPTGREIGRRWRFPKPRVAAAYATFVSELAASEGQPIHLGLAGADVTLTLTSRLRGGSREGLTEKVFRFAAHLG